jgi:hypothetical protein
VEAQGKRQQYHEASEQHDRAIDTHDLSPDCGITLPSDPGRSPDHEGFIGLGL